MNNNIEPLHYKVGDVYEVINVIDAWQLDFRLGNAVKYIARAGKKDNSKEIEDLQKAKKYIEMKIQSLESSKIMI